MSDRRAATGSIRAERQADANLARLLRGNIGHDAVDADDAEQQRHAGGDGEHHEGERGLRHRRRRDLLDGADPRERQVPIDRADGLSDLVHEPGGTRPARSDDVCQAALGERRAAEERLDHAGPVHDRRRLLRDRVLPLVGDNADDLPPRDHPAPPLRRETRSVAASFPGDLSKERVPPGGAHRPNASRLTGNQARNQRTTPTAKVTITARGRRDRNTATRTHRLGINTSM